MIALIVVFALAGLVLIGAFARLVVLRRQWRNEPPPRYRSGYRRWDDDEPK